MNSYYLFTSLLIIFFIINNSICNGEMKYIITEFASKYPYENEEHYFYDNYTNNYLFAKIKLGSNEQMVEMKIDLNKYETYIVKDDAVDKKLYIPYNTSSSKTFNTSIMFYSQYNDFQKAYLANDNLICNNGKNDITLNNFYFAYVDYGFNKFAGSVGFNLMNTAVYPVESMNYIDQLKNSSIISGYSMTIKFSSNYKGSLLIGPDVEEIIPKEIEKYKKSVIKASGKGINDGGKWLLEFERVIVGDSELLNSKLVEFDLKYDFIIATDEFSEFIFKNYFSKYFGTQRCIREELRTFKYFQGIKCKKDVDLKDFPNITFSIPPIEYEPFNLILDYKDLFEEIGDYKYFKIIITYNDEESSVGINKNWIFGKIFFKLYLVTFNKDRKDISIYYQEKKDSDNVEPNSKDSKSQLNEGDFNKIIWIWILIGILLIMSVIIILLLIKCVKQGHIIKKRNRLNILEDELSDENIN